MNPIDLKGYAPVITEETEKGVRQYDLSSRMLKDRIIMIGTAIDSNVSNSVVNQLLYLDHLTESDPQPINVYINSPGGSVNDGLAIYDIMQFCKSEIRTYAFGQASSMGSLLLCAGAKGHRYALPHSSIMVHQPLIRGGGITGQVTDIEIQAQYLGKIKNKLTKIYEKHTGLSLEKLEKLLDRDTFLTAEEAIELGLIDSILSKKP